MTVKIEPSTELKTDAQIESSTEVKTVTDAQVEAPSEIQVGFGKRKFLKSLLIGGTFRESRSRSRSRSGSSCATVRTTTVRLAASRLTLTLDRDVLAVKTRLCTFWVKRSCDRPGEVAD